MGLHEPRCGSTYFQPFYMTIFGLSFKHTPAPVPTDGPLGTRRSNTRFPSDHKRFWVAAPRILPDEHLSEKGAAGQMEPPDGLPSNAIRSVVNEDDVVHITAAKRQILPMAGSIEPFRMAVNAVLNDCESRQKRLPDVHRAQVSYRPKVLCAAQVSDTFTMWGHWLVP